MKTLIFVFAAVAGSLNAQTFAEKMLGDKNQREIGYKVDGGIAQHGTVIKYSQSGNIEVVEIDPGTRTIFVADPKDGHVLYYFPKFENCNSGERVVRYALHNSSVAGMKETLGSISWQCAVRQKMVTKPVGSNTKRGTMIQHLFENVALRYMLPAKAASARKVAPATDRSQGNFGWRFTVADWVILIIAIAVFCVGVVRSDTRVAAGLAFACLVYALVMGSAVFFASQIAYFPSPLGGAGIVQSRHLPWHTELWLILDLLLNCAVGLVPLVALGFGRLLRNKGSRVTILRRPHVMNV